MFNHSLDQQIEKNEKRMQELEIQNETLTNEAQTLLEELKLSTQQLENFVANQDNFSKENWDEMQNQHQKLDAKLQLDLDNIRNPLKIKKAYKSRKIESTWLFIR